MEIRKAIIPAIIFIVVLYFFFRKKTEENDEAKKQMAAKIKGQPWYKTIVQEANNYNLPPARVAAIVAVESGGNVMARGAAGEYGLMQIMPVAHKEVKEHWKRLVFWQYDRNDETLLNADYNILVGTAYLAILKERFARDLDKATEAYNDGGGYGTDYLDKVKAYEPYFWGLYT